MVRRGRAQQWTISAAYRLEFFARLKSIDEASANRLVIPGINAYNQGEYQRALSLFLGSIMEIPAFEEELRPHINICNRVIHTVLSPHDIEYSDAYTNWERLPFFMKWFRRAPRLKRRSKYGAHFTSYPRFKLRCKYCGHFTSYIDPNEGFAYLRQNNCENCGRGYPMPDFAWDGIDGQAYIYYRNSVTEPEFYREFEAQFDVEVDHKVFSAARSS
jgi:hypothetical protein